MNSVEGSVVEVRQDIEKSSRFMFLLILFLPCILVINMELQNDTWFLLNSGRYVVENGFPFIEPFSIHEGFEFVMQQWMSACIFWLSYSYFGVLGLKIVVLVCYAMITYVIYRLCMLVSNNYFFISFCLTLFASLVISLTITDRPSIFSTLLLTLEIYLLENYRATDKPKYLLPIPILSVLLINLHAAMWPMMFIFFLPYLIESFQIKIGKIFHRGQIKGPLYIITGITFFAGFLNPYGIGAMTYLLNSYGSSRIKSLVDEMHPPNINTIYGLIIFSFIFIVVLIYLIYRRGDTKFRYILLTLGTAFLLLSSTRNLPFFAVCGVFPLAFYLRGIEFHRIKSNVDTARTKRLRIILSGMIVLLLAFSLINAQMQTSEPTNEESKSKNQLLMDTINYMKDESPASDIILYTGYNDGGMAEFMGIQAYFDPRAEVFLKTLNKKEDIVEEYCDLQSGYIYYKDFVRKYQFTHLIVTKYDILYIELMHDEDYEITFSNKVYTLFEKEVK